MTRRALRPRVSAGAGAAPAASKATEPPCCAFGSIAVLICFAFPALVGGARRHEKTFPKRGRRERRAVLNVPRILRLAAGSEGEKIPGSRQAFRPGLPHVLFPSQAARSIHSRPGAVNKYNT